MRVSAGLCLVLGWIGTSIAGEPLLGVDLVAPGLYHSCALAGGRVVCWGANDAGQLGNGARTGATLAVEVVGLPGPATAIAAGAAHGCAIGPDQRVRCWGVNDSG
jgi:alpha-tubulin suppressor-like RCC1 family protein